MYKIKRAGSRAQDVEYLPSIQEALGSIPSLAKQQNKKNELASTQGSWRGLRGCNCHVMSLS
jgi:hypothetical protein